MDISIAALWGRHEKENERDSLKRLWVWGNNGGSALYAWLAPSSFFLLTYPCPVYVASLAIIKSVW